MPFRAGPLLRSACFGAAIAVVTVTLYESTQERGQPGILDISTNEAYVGHFAIYALMAFLTLIALAPRSWYTLALVLLLTTALGIGLELFQAHLSTRTASASDALADAAGALCGIAAYVSLMALLEPKQGPPTKS